MIFAQTFVLFVDVNFCERLTVSWYLGAASLHPKYGPQTLHFDFLVLKVLAVCFWCMTLLDREPYQVE